jgi:hypothetical protein
VLFCLKLGSNDILGLIFPLDELFKAQKSKAKQSKAKQKKKKKKQSRYTPLWRLGGEGV